ncbi:MAG: hypothetical protein AAGC90_10625, partial [Curtobacterium sp.]
RAAVSTANRPDRSHPGTRRGDACTGATRPSVVRRHRSAVVTGHDTPLAFGERPQIVGGGDAVRRIVTTRRTGGGVS